MTENLLALAQKHYENFPVGSLFLSKKYREPIHLIYAYARVADDIADEGNADEQERIQRLNEWEQLLMQSIHGTVSDVFFRKLTETIDHFSLPISYFKDLITAFRKDTTNPTYTTIDEVLDYCHYSANPIGRLLLSMFKCSNAQNEYYSDKICTALQLTNFWQDISVDTRRNRFYIPASDLQRFGLTFADCMRKEKQNEFRQLMKFEVERTRALFEEGKPLLSIINGEFRKELYFIFLGGTRVLEKIQAANFDTRHFRPVLSKGDMIFLAMKSLLS